MNKFTFLRSSFMVAVLLWFCSLSVAAQVPSTMDYQILATHPKTGMVLANKKMTVRVELRLNAEDGETIWSTEEKVTSSKSGVCTISLDFADVDWSLGTYFIKAFVDGDPIGSSQIKSVPFALVADGVRGVITKKKLIGTWVAVDENDKDGRTIFTFAFHEDGSFSYSEVAEYEKDVYNGNWKLNNLGYLICDNIIGKYHQHKTFFTTVYDKDDQGLIIFGGDNTFLYEQLTFYKRN